MTDPQKIYRLEMETGPQEGRRYVVRNPSALLGSDAKCRIQIESGGIAAQHLAIRLVGDRAVLTVLEQADPVRIGGEEVRERDLADGDVFEVGDVRLVFHWIEPMPVYTTRPRSLVEWASMVAVGAVVVFQVILLLLLGSVRIGPAQPAGALGEGGADSVAIEDERGARTIAGRIVALRTRTDALDRRIQRMSEEPELVAPVAVIPGVGDAETPDPPPDESPRLLGLARDAIASGNWRQAESLLDRAQAANPARAEVYRARARLYETQRDYAASLRQWELTLARAGSDGEIRREAQDGRARVQEVIRQDEARRRAREAQARKDAEARERAAAEARLRAQAANDSVARPAADPPPAPARRIRIRNIRRERFSNRENYEEVRMVQFDLVQRKSSDPVAVEDVAVEVRFFDRDQASGQVAPSRVPAPTNGLALDGHWPPGDAKTLSALYMVPQGFRQSEKQSLGVDRQYYGFVVRVLLNGRLQDTQAFPSSLLERVDPSP